MRRPVPASFKSKLPTSSAALDTPQRVIDFCIKHNFITQYGAVNIEALIVSDPQLSLKFEDLGDKDAYIKCEREDFFLIGIHKYHHKNRQTFSMAHEYGHYQLHRHDIKNIKVGERILHRDGEISPIERQANAFAANILMPEDAVTSVMSEANNNVSAAANMLGVSMAAFVHRLNYLGIKGAPL